MTTSSGVQAIKAWQDGLTELDPKKVEAALQSGIRPNLPLQDKSPFEIVLKNGERPSLSDLFSIFHSSRKMVCDSDENFEKKQEIFKLLLNAGASLFEATGTPPQPLIDTLLDAQDILGLSVLIIAALKESAQDQKRKDLYHFDLKKILAGLAPKNEQEKNILAIGEKRDFLQKKMKRLKKVHDHVRMVLTQIGDEETRGFYEREKERLTFWTNSFDGIPSDDLDAILPFDEEAFKKAQKEANRKKEFFDAGFGGNNQDSFSENDVVKLAVEEPEKILAELDAYIGLERFKKGLRALCYRVGYDKACVRAGLKTDVQNYHTAFLGNPGTGKTTCSRLKARLLHSLGLTGNRYIELSRDKIISKYFGNTEGKVKEIIENVDILFIDEAYSLLSNANDHQDYGRRAIDTLVNALGSRKDNFTLFLAGYTDPTLELISSNEGFSSRIKIFESMPDYTEAELAQILDQQLLSQQYIVPTEVRTALCLHVNQEKKRVGKTHFGNARTIVDIVQTVPTMISLRLGERFKGDFTKASAEDLKTLTLKDVETLAQTRLPNLFSKGTKRRLPLPASGLN